MIVDGLSIKEMAKELFVADGRLRNIITELIAKLMVKDKTQLAIFAIKNKLV
jgi:DNA-binding NarL/FixJ family response regulator